MINYQKKNSRGEFLVAIIKTKNDFKIALEEYWYRIRVRSVEKLLKNRFPPQGIAFYQAKIFGDEAYSINYYAEVISIEKMMRRELFPHEKINVKSNNLYYKLRLSSLQKLPKPIYSRRWRRITFIPTTWEKFNIEARKRIPRDYNDWETVALSLALSAAIWTEDSDFFGCGCPTWTTETLLLQVNVESF